MLFDPIFQGLAIAVMFGAVASTLLTLVVVPLLYYEFFKNKPCPYASPVPRRRVRRGWWQP